MTQEYVPSDNHKLCMYMQQEIERITGLRVYLVRPSEYKDKVVLPIVHLFTVVEEMSRLVHLTKSASSSLQETAMSKQHTTKDGETMLIAAMRDSHLWNTIKLICDQIEEQIVIINGEYTADTDPFMSAMMPQSNVQAQRDMARNRLQHLVNSLPNYVMEATLRDFEDVPALLQETFRRSKKITARSQSNKPLLLDGAVE